MAFAADFSALPRDCLAVFFGTQALVHPGSGIVFGFATGTHSYALRPPPTERAAALRAGANRLWCYATGKEVLDLETIGVEWVLCGGLSGRAIAKGTGISEGRCGVSCFGGAFARSSWSR